MTGFLGFILHLDSGSSRSQKLHHPAIALFKHLRSLAKPRKTKTETMKQMRLYNMVFKFSASISQQCDIWHIRKWLKVGFATSTKRQIRLVCKFCFLRCFAQADRFASHISTKSFDSVVTSSALELANALYTSGFGKMMSDAVRTYRMPVCKYWESLQS